VLINPLFLRAYLARWSAPAFPAGNPARASPP
jgi:hypothetical protein